MNNKSRLYVACTKLSYLYFTCLCNGGLKYLPTRNSKILNTPTK